MMMSMEKDRCPLCGSFGTNTRQKNIFICPKCTVPFNEFGISPLAEVAGWKDSEYVSN